MSETHTDPGKLDGMAPPPLMLTMSGDEPAVMCWRVEDLDAALAAAHDMGLPVALDEDVAEELGFGPERAGSAEEQHLEEMYLAQEELDQ